MVPAQLVAEAVAVFPDARSKPPDFLYQRVTIEIGEFAPNRDARTRIA